VFQGRTAEALPQLLKAEEALRRHTHGSQRIAGSNRVRMWRAKSLLDLGHLLELRHLYDEIYQRALDTGDRLQGIGLTRIAGPVLLWYDEAQRYSTELASHPIFSPLHTTSVLHWFDLRAREELAIFTGDVAAQAGELRRAHRQIARSMIGRRSQLARVEIAWGRGRTLLGLLDEGAATRADLAELRRIVTGLRRENGFDLAILFASMLDAAIDSRRSDRHRCREHLQTVIDLSKGRGNLLYLASARYHLGVLTDGEPLPEALQYFADQGVPDHEQALRIYMPGFGNSGLHSS
jgi:hypothetical protein